ncbi:hypothetical protein Rsub_00495 [Raphidocelis subcapitata]|uniref:Uncharacterized protein n=1 Tax=Raphidocelis subcapitata TaxID=307507 RepID=A0A2V0NKE1_9CHLO|nr:hypothetical protein Rsub_00495 [Raphidocelis subcapitata]|eukprot:GBF87784.1 hypothetical protein Rsub_00495 [Raphidocelis subcapitata]
MSSDDAHKAELKERFAEEKFDKSYEELSTKEKRQVAGYMGAEIKKEKAEAEEGAHSPRSPRARRSGSGGSPHGGAHASADELRAHLGERKEEVALEKYHKHYEDLDTHEKRSIRRASS